MPEIRIFISSVQKEFREERQFLWQYIQSDPLLGAFFKPFLFENQPASSTNTETAYLEEVSASDIYLGILGNTYGFEDKNGISPTEKEFDLATSLGKERLLYIMGTNDTNKHPKEKTFINKIGIGLVRKRCTSFSDLRSGIYASLVKYLQDHEYIRTGPFDASLCRDASFNDIDREKVKLFLQSSIEARNFPLSISSSKTDVLTHLDLTFGSRLKNAALLLFGTKPQKFFVSSEVKCAYFHGTTVVKPIPSYKILTGDVFELVDKSVDFVLSKLSVEVGTRMESNQVPIHYEIPRPVVSEAIVNAIAHRDYAHNGSVQVMLFKNRLEISNPGTLPHPLTVEKLKVAHNSIPRNPLLANALFLAGYIEKVGTGTKDIFNLSNAAGLSEPIFDLSEGFKLTIWRPGFDSKSINDKQSYPNKHRASTGQVPGKYRASLSEIDRTILVTVGEMKRSEIQMALDLKHRDHFRDNYLLPAIKEGLIELTIPNKPKSSKQRYRLTAKGQKIRTKLIKKKK